MTYMIPTNHVMLISSSKRSWKARKTKQKKNIFQKNIMRKQTEIQRIISYHDKRNGSGKLLCTFMIKLSLVFEYISGPGNWPLIRIPYHQKKKLRLSRYDTLKKMCAQQNSPEYFIKKYKPVDEHRGGICHHR